MIPRIVFVLALFATGISARAAEPADAAHRKMAFLCDWSRAKMPNTPAVLCDEEAMAGASDTDIIESMDEFWKDWEKTSPRAGKSLKVAFDRAYLAKYPPPPHVFTSADLESASIDRLCKLVRAKGPAYPMAINELVRRNTFSANELRLVKLHTIEVGMSLQALICAWGESEDQNRTVTAAGERIQHIYGRTLVYTENAVVTAYQD